MARPIPYEPRKVDERVELLHKLQRAPADHAAALLDAVELLQALHDRGAIDLARGFIGSADEVLQIAVDEALLPESVRAMRNLIVLTKLLGSIDPETLKTALKPIPEALARKPESTKAPGLFRLMKDSLFNQDFRRGLGVTIAMLRGLGTAVKPKEQGTEESTSSD